LYLCSIREGSLATVRSGGLIEMRREIQKSRDLTVGLPGLMLATLLAVTCMSFAWCVTTGHESLSYSRHK